MERRLIMFLVVSFAIMFGYTMLLQKFGPKVAKNPPAAAQADKKDEEKSKPQAGDKKNAEKDAAEKKTAEKVEKPAEEKKPEEKAAIEAVEPAIPEEWITLGSVDPNDPYRMMATLTNRGAALARIELSDPKYRDIDIRSGYLGHIISEAKAGGGKGCPVQVVGPGTPAEKAGLRVGDLIVQAAGKDIASADALKNILGRTRPGNTLELSILRDGKPQTLTATLTRYPLEVIRPPYPLEMMPPPEDGPLKLNENDPLSMLMTLQQIDDEKLPDLEKGKDVDLDAELKGVSLRGGVWRKVEADREHAVFEKKVPKYGLEISKIYRLKKVPEAAQKESDYPAYHLVVEVKIANLGEKDRKVAYRLDGPNGLPTEGYWYANKVSRNWGGAGLRDVLVSINRATPSMIVCATIADNKLDPPWDTQPITYVGVDAQYFSAILIPQMKSPEEVWFGPSQAIAVGKVDPLHKNWTNTSVRLVSLPNSISAGTSFAQEYELFAGPKKPSLVDQYGLSEIVYYGWPIFEFVAKLMRWFLHMFYFVVQNYGLAIILLTVLVRGLMFPLSFKQAVGAQKMAEIQPEMKRIAEKYKKDAEGRTKAMQELYRKHNYNPLSGCFPIFIQLPIFIGLYKSLMVDVELRDAPLISSAVRWCSNLAAPDMLFDWHRFMDLLPTFIQTMFGPYFNVLPFLTIFLFLWQQQKMMPPPTDEQQAMQQKMMKYMMIFMGVMFFKVASGLCIYFIASSLWGLGERQFLPKKDAAKTGLDNAPPRNPPSGSNGDGGRSKRKKDRDRR